MPFFHHFLGDSLANNDGQHNRVGSAAATAVVGGPQINNNGGLLKQLKAGYLLHFKKRLFGKAWKEEFLVLFEDSSLIWFRDKDRLDPEGGLFLRDAPEMIAAGQWVNRVPFKPEFPDGCDPKHSIAIGSRNREKVHWLLCKSNAELIDWMSAISHTLPPPPPPPEDLRPSRLNLTDLNLIPSEYRYHHEAPPAAVVSGTLPYSRRMSSSTSTLHSIPSLTSSQSLTSAPLSQPTAFPRSPAAAVTPWNMQAKKVSSAAAANHSKRTLRHLPSSPDVLLSHRLDQLQVNEASAAKVTQQQPQPRKPAVTNGGLPKGISAGSRSFSASRLSTTNAVNSTNKDASGKIEDYCQGQTTTTTSLSSGRDKVRRAGLGSSVGDVAAGTMAAGVLTQLQDGGSGGSGGEYWDWGMGWGWASNSASYCGTCAMEHVALLNSQIIPQAGGVSTSVSNAKALDVFMADQAKSSASPDLLMMNNFDDDHELGELGETDLGCDFGDFGAF